MSKNAKRKAASGPKIINIDSADSPSSALAEIQSRAIGGKVAIMERGAPEAKVINMSEENKTTQEKNKENLEKAIDGMKEKKAERSNKNRAEAASPAHPQEIPLKDASIEQIKDLQDEMNAIDLEIGRNTKLYLATVNQLQDQSKNVGETLQSTIRRTLKKHGAPDGWVVNLDTMTIVPNPNQPQMMMRPPSN